MYHAFLSYSHKDYLFAKQLQRALKTFGQYPWARARIFRDDTDLGTSSDLTASLKKAIGQSQHFVLLASPGSAESPWVITEVQHFLESGGTLDRVSIAVVDGQTNWLDPDWEEKDGKKAIAAEVARIFPRVPKVVDLRRFRDKSHSFDQLANDCREEVAGLVSSILRIGKQAIVEREDWKRFWKNVAKWAFVAALAVVMVLVGWQFKSNAELKGQIDRIDAAAEQLEKTLEELPETSGSADSDQRGQIEQQVADLRRQVIQVAHHSDQLSHRDIARIRNAQATAADAILGADAYRINPPDVLLVDAIHPTLRGPYHLHAGDAVYVSVDEAIPDSPIDAAFAVDIDGTIALPEPYGPVRVAGMTLADAKLAVIDQLRKTLREPSVSFRLWESRGLQQIAGPHLVAPDGRITLGMYGQVPVKGMTVVEAKQAVEKHLRQFLEDPVVSLDVQSYNSMVYYVTVRETERGDLMAKFPVMGSHTVSDALSNLGTLPPVQSVEIHNPAFKKALTVDWEAIQSGDFSTDYRLLAGDRIVVHVAQTR